MRPAVALLLLTAMTCASAQEANAPALKAGDKWVVERFDHWKREVVRSREHRVLEVTPTTLRLESRDPASGRALPYVTDLSLNVLESEGRKFEPPFRYYAFPLAVGKKWAYKAAGINESGTGNFSQDVACEVLAYEDVATKAGTFKAYKVRCDGTWISTDGRNEFRGQLQATRWYAPEVRFPVKFEYKTVNARGVWDNYVDQVVSFDLQK